MLNKSFKEFISLSAEQKLILLQALDYNIDSNGFVVDKTNKKVKCKYSNKPVLFNDASILPGSTIIINTSLITLSEYISDYLEKSEEE